MKTSKAYHELKPYIVGLIGDTLAKKGLTSVAGGSGGTELVAHGLNSAFHTGTLADSQAPQFLKTDGSRTLTGNLTVSASVTIDGVDISAHAADSAAHHDPATAGDGISVTGQQVAVNLDSPSGLIINSGQLSIASTVAGDGLTIANKVIDVGAGDGISVSADAVAVDLATNSGLGFNSGLEILDAVAGGGLAMSASKVLSVNVGDGLEISSDTVAVDLAATSGLVFSSGDLALADSIAGAGLSIASKVLAVNVGSGLVIDTDNVVIDLASNSGLDFNAGDLTMGTPSQITTSSTNSLSTTTHNHSIDHSNDPGASAKILSSTASGGLTLQSLNVEGNVDIISGGDLTVGANILFVDASLASIGVNRAPDPQFSVDVAGALRATYLVGPHAIQLKEATGIWHFDGPGPINTNFYGTPNPHMGYVPNQEQNLHYLPGKFQKALALSDGAVTNLMQNPSFETNTTGWTTVSGTPTRTLNRPFTGSYSMRLEDGDEMHSFSSWLSVAVGETLYVSAAFWCENGASGRLRLYNTTSASFVDTGDTVTSDEWEIVGARWTNDTAGTRTIRVYVDNDTGSDADLFVDSVCATIDKPSAYVDGSMPNASWSGTAHASTSSLDGTPRLRFSGSAFVDYREGTIMCWFMPTAEIDHDALNDFILHYESGATEDTIRISQNHDGVYGFEFAGTTVTGGTVTPGEWVHLAVTWRRANSYFECYVNGTSVGSGSSSALDSPTGNTYFTVGRDGQNDTNHVGGYIDEVAVTGRFLEDEDVLTIYESEAPVFAESSVFHFRATPTQLVWADDEGLWVRNTSGEEVFGIYAGEAATKSWAGLTLGQNDLVIGDSARNGYLHLDDSAGTLHVEGNIVITGGSGIASLSDAGALAVLDSVDLSTGEVTNKNLDNISNTASWRRTAATAIDGSGLVLLDQTVEGTYGRVLATAISAGNILLSQASGDLDDISDGSAFAKVDQTILNAGFIQVGTGTKDSSLNGFHINASEIVGQASGDDQVVMGTDGAITFGAGAGTLTETGVQIDRSTSATPQSTNAYEFVDGATSIGGLFSYTPSSQHFIDLLNNRSASANGVFIKSETSSSSHTASAGISVDRNGMEASIDLVAASSGTPNPSISVTASGGSTTVSSGTINLSATTILDVNAGDDIDMDADNIYIDAVADLALVADDISLTSSFGEITLSATVLNMDGPLTDSDLKINGTSSILLYGSNVGIGSSTMTASETLHVDGGSDSAIARFETDRASGGGFVIEASATGGKVWQGISTANTHAAGGGKYIIKEFGGSNNFVFTSDGKFGLKVTSPETEFDLDGAIQLRELSATPSSTPTADVEAQVYVKANKFIIRWNDAGTVKYRYLDLTSTDATWTYTTTAP